MSVDEDPGIVWLPSNFTFAQTLERLEAALKSKGLQTFCRIDHSGEAAKIGLAMLPAFLIIFGSPSAGTPLMVEASTLALDLPLKALVSEDKEGAVWVTYNSVDYLRRRHAIVSDAHALVGAAHLLAQVAGVGTKELPS